MKNQSLGFLRCYQLALDEIEFTLVPVPLKLGLTFTTCLRKDLNAVLY
jgi:hypothetical protein